MAKKVNIRVNSSARVSSNGNIHVRTSISNGRTTRTINKTIRAK